MAGRAGDTETTSLGDLAFLAADALTTLDGGGTSGAGAADVRSGGSDETKADGTRRARSSGGGDATRDARSANLTDSTAETGRARVAGDTVRVSVAERARTARSSTKVVGGVTRQTRLAVLAISGEGSGRARRAEAVSGISLVTDGAGVAVARTRSSAEGSIRAKLALSIASRTLTSSAGRADGVVSRALSTARASLAAHGSGRGRDRSGLASLAPSSVTGEETSSAADASGGTSDGVGFVTRGADGTRLGTISGGDGSSGAVLAEATEE